MCAGTTYDAAGSFLMPAAAVTLFSLWTANPPPPPTYTVSFNAEGGLPVPAVQTGIVSGGHASAPTAPSKSGFTFTGWNTHSDGSGTNWIFTSDAVTSNLFLYAQYTANGGSGGGSPPPGTTPPGTAPSAPVLVSAAAGDGQVTVSWSAPPSDGGASITSYTVIASSGGATCSVSAPLPSPLQCTVTGLTNGTPYTFTVTATNSIGTGAASEVSNVATPHAARHCATTTSQQCLRPVIMAVSPSHGPTHGGQKVTISGRNFAVGDTVKIGTGRGRRTAVVIAKDTIRSATTITAAMPAHRHGRFNIWVFTPSGIYSRRVSVDHYVYRRARRK
jgi:uncharacterized repeat protein (TIGR02543 family)